MKVVGEPEVVGYSKTLGRDVYLCVIVHDSEPASLEISGEDVEGLSSRAGIAAGSVLKTPDSRYVAYEDGVFTKDNA